jgi:iron-sulfur cluster assembly protein
MKMEHRQAEITLTAAARDRIRERAHQDGHAGIRLAVREAGCSGLEYVMDYADSPDEGDYVKQLGDIAVFVDAASYERALAGLTIDYQQDALSSGFVFVNPNKKGECGCGASFTV